MAFKPKMQSGWMQPKRKDAPDMMTIPAKKKKGKKVRDYFA